MKILLIVSEDWRDFDLVFQTVQDIVNRNVLTDVSTIQYLAESPRAQLWSELIADSSGFNVYEASDFKQDLCLSFITSGDEYAETLTRTVESNDIPVVKYKHP